MAKEKTMGLLFRCLCMLLVLRSCVARTQLVGQINPGFETSQMEWVEQDGLFLLSKSSTFGLRFYRGVDVQTYLLVIIHVYSSEVVWTANRGLLLVSSSNFVFDKNGNVYLMNGSQVIWATNTTGQSAASMKLLDSGNLVLLGDDGKTLWQSFDHPTDTLLPGQAFVEGMRLKSFPRNDDKSYYLEFKPGNLVLSIGYQTPQYYWYLADDSQIVTNQTVNSKVHSASLVSNSWNFYDQKEMLLWQFNFSKNSDANATWVATLGSQGFIEFRNLQSGIDPISEAIRIPQNSCSVPEHCGPYDVCFFDNFCKCAPPVLSTYDCRPPIVSSCNSSNSPTKLFYVGEKLDYFALGFETPKLNFSLDACKEACVRNCSCAVLFFDNATSKCFLFDQVGGLQRAKEGTNGFVSYMKVLENGNVGPNTIRKGSRNGETLILYIIIIVIGTILIIIGLLYAGVWFHRKQKKPMKSTQEMLEEDNFFDSLSGMPTRFCYDELCKATKGFSTKVGQGGFGSVYLGVMPDGSRLAVKKLEGIGQGKKEFRAEVQIIGSIHHMHLVKLKGFCAEGVHRLLVYEFMANGSLDKWIFKNEESCLLDWNTRFNIALGTAKGLAYLHEECELKIVHCDIKPENVLLDDNYAAKVSDFGLAKLMNREESLVYTTLRGTRGYLAPEWITNNPISEKSDVYSYGMVLLEIIGGRKNYDSRESSEKSHLASYAFKMLDEGRLKEILDPRLQVSEDDERVVNAIKVALWCVQDDMRLRPRMTKVVQMLESLCDIPHPPSSLQAASRPYSGFLKWSSEEGSSSGMLYSSDSNTFVSDVRLSGPR